MGGPSAGDAGQSVNTTWLMAHGHFACAYPPHNEWDLSFVAPLLSLISVLGVSIFRIGQATPFPSSSAMGLHCNNANNAVTSWAIHSHALIPTLWVGVGVWLVLAAGTIALFWTIQGKVSYWTVLAIGLLAVAPPVLATVISYFHPQDVLAVGLILASLAYAGRNRWFAAGVWLGVAFTAQQFSALAIVALFVAAVRHRRIFATGVATGFLPVALFVVALSHGTATRAILIGSGNGYVDPGSIAAELHLFSPIWVVLLRYATFCGAAFVAWYLEQRFGERILQPLALTSLVGTALACRLVFEINVFDYYFMTVCVFMILVAILERRFSLAVLIWIVVTSLISANSGIFDGVFDNLPTWLIQSITVPTALWLVSAPLRRMNQSVDNSKEWRASLN
jgi:hypothetical protein